MNCKKTTKFTKRTRHRSHQAAHLQAVILAAQAHHHLPVNAILQREAVLLAAAVHQVTLAHHHHHHHHPQAVQAHQAAQALPTQAHLNLATQTQAKASIRKDLI
jgi:hypothetical protein